MEPISVGDINLLREQNEELRNAYNAILEQCKKEQTENERLKQENEILRTNSLQIQKWLDEERADNDKLQQVYQDDHCELLKYKQKFIEIKEIVHERVNGENIKGWDYFTGITDI